MLKKLEREQEDSCWNKAKEDEPIFVLLGRDVATPETVVNWIKARIKEGKNKPDDPQITEACIFIGKVIGYQKSLDK